MYKIKKLNAISNVVNEYFSDKDFVELEQNDENAILVRSADMHAYNTPNTLLAVARAGAGVNNIPTAEFAKKGIFVFNTPGANANAVKELTILALLLSCRDVLGGVAWAGTLNDDVPQKVEKGKKAFVGPELFGKTLGVIGCGAIGGMVAKTALAFGMNLILYDPFISQEMRNLSKDKSKVVDDISEVFKGSDFITLHVPLNSYTVNTINKNALSIMKDGVRIINCARGELVNDLDIIQALQSKKVACYVTDFPNQNLIGIPNVITIPHLGASTPESEENCAVMAAKQLKDFLDYGNTKNCVNLPNLTLPYQGYFRVTVVATDQNSAQTEKELSSYQPCSFAKASRNGYTYYICDFAQKVDVALSSAIKVRTINN